MILRNDRVFKVSIGISTILILYLWVLYVRPKTHNSIISLEKTRHETVKNETTAVWSMQHFYI